MVSGNIIDAQWATRQMVELWTPLTERQQRLLADNITIQRYKKNEVIYHEGELPECLFCLLKGKVKIFKEGIGGRTQIVRMARPMGFFGYRAGFANDQYSTSASAFEPSTLCQIPMPVVKALILDNNRVAVYFIQQLANLLRHADEQTVNLTQKHIRGRLAEGLLRLKEHYGTEADRQTLNIQLSREDLASLSNMTTSNAIRTLSAFAGENLITIEGRRITLIDEEKLHHISHLG